MISREELQARIKAYADANGIPFEEFARHVNAGAERMRAFSRSMDELVASAGVPSGELPAITNGILQLSAITGAYPDDIGEGPLSGVPLPPGVMGTGRPGEIEGEWWLFEEPPAFVTRVRSDDFRDVVIRHHGKPELWATILADGTPVIPQDGVTQEQGLGWVAWLDLGLMAVMYDDTANDRR
jgi:hypothetical protein